MAAADAVPSVVGGSVTSGAKAVGKFSMKKLIAGIAAAAIVTGSAAAVILLPDNSETIPDTPPGTSMENPKPNGGNSTSTNTTTTAPATTETQTPTTTVPAVPTEEEEA